MNYNNVVYNGRLLIINGGGIPMSSDDLLKPGQKAPESGQVEVVAPRGIDQLMGQIISPYFN